MARDPLRALECRYELDAQARAKLATLLDMLVHDPLAPTSVRELPQVVDDHLADSLVALELDEVVGARWMVDIGSGAGLPALPLAAALPALQVVALDSSSRKAAFISRVIERCRIDNACAATARAEAWPEGLDRFDIVTARAVAPLDVVAEYASPLLRVGGALIAWRGRRDPAAEAAVAAAAAPLGLAVGAVHSVRPYRTAEHRHLHVIAKVSPTPAGFPRREGVARKRPLGLTYERLTGLGVSLP